MENKFMTTTTTKKVVTEFRLNKEWVLKAMKKMGWDFGKAEIKVEFQVPGGADWSGMLIDVDNNNPLIVTVETINVETKSE